MVIYALWMMPLAVTGVTDEALLGRKVDHHACAHLGDPEAGRVDT